MSAGRNDPCPCGSGKKYKRCCMNNVVSIDAIIGRELDKLQDELFSKFGEYEEELFQIVDDVRDGISGELDHENEQLLFTLIIMWAIFHERIPSATTVEKFVEEKRRSKQIRPSVLSIIEEWPYVAPSYAVITRIIDDEQVELEEMLTREKKKVHVDHDHGLSDGSVLLGFLLPYGTYEKYFLFYLDYPPSIADNLRTGLEMSYELSGMADPAQFMAEEFPVILEAMFAEPDLADVNGLEWEHQSHADVVDIFYEVWDEVMDEDKFLGNVAVGIWYQYCKQHHPTFRKPEVYAAGLHYLMNEHFSRVTRFFTQKELAEIYEVHPASLSKAYRQIEEGLGVQLSMMVEEVMDDLFGDKDEGGSPAQLARMALERELGALSEAVQDMEFESEEEFREFADNFFKNNEYAADTPKDRAMDLIYQALETRNEKKRVKLAEQALEIDPYCVDAFNILGEAAGDMESAKKYFEKGIKIGEQELGKKFIEENRGMFWGLIETRPYMRAKHNYAVILDMLGHPYEAMDQYEDMLELNENDNQGVRYELFTLYMEMDEYDKAEALLEKYNESNQTAGAYNALLLEFEQNGFTSKLEKLYTHAVKVNPYVVDYIVENRQLPDFPPDMYQLGSEEEAQAYCFDTLHLWDEQLEDWLRERQ